jgi:hypothetical protein
VSGALPLPCRAVDDLAPEALQRLGPHLGPLVRDPERVDGQHPDHPDQTFDYFAERTDGRRLAIEVVHAWDEDWLATDDAWRGRVEDVEATVRRRNAAVTGAYAMTVRRAGNPRANDYEAAALAGKLRQCYEAGVRTEVSVDQAVSFRYVCESPDLVVEAVRSAWEFEGGPENEARLRKALEAKIPTMRRAGEAGYETHLAVVHWVLGSTHGWRQFLAENALEAAPDLANVRYRAAVQRWAECEAQESLLVFELDRVVEAEGLESERAEQVERRLNRVRSKSQKLRAELGLSPRGHVELVSGRAHAEREFVDLAGLRARGRASIEAREQLEEGGS